MDNKEEIEDSIEFVKDIRKYYESNQEVKKRFHHPEYQNNHKEYRDIRNEQNNSSIINEITEESDRIKSKDIIKELSKLILIAIISYVFAIFVTTYVGQYTMVDGVSMENTIQNKDYLVIDKVTYRFQNPKRFDIIVFPYSNREYFIKRVIGVPGDKVQIINDTIYINDKPLNENYGREPIKNAGDAIEPMTLSKDEYFVMGDNRNESLDSRDSSVGTIIKDKIVGKAVFRIWPLNKVGRIK